MSLPVCVVDAFAEKPFTGNPAAVVLLDGPRDDAWRAAVAREFNLSETAFVEPEKGGVFPLRWFSPAVEIDLCGHATMAAAHALWETGRLRPDAAAAFETRGGRLTARREDGYIVLDMPARPVTQAKPPAGFLAALRETPLWLGESGGLLLAEMDSEETVRKVAPDFAALAAAAPKGLIVTAAARRKTYDFVSRGFFPAEGIPEDPVTGSAHCSLAPFWAARLGKPVLTAYQASARGGVLLLRDKGGRVDVGGKALTAWTGSLRHATL